MIILSLLEFRSLTQLLKPQRGSYRPTGGMPDAVMSAVEMDEKTLLRGGPVDASDDYEV